VGETVWKFLPGTTERSELLFRETWGPSVKYIPLKPNSYVEFEQPDWANPQPGGAWGEHAFSVFVKTGGKNSAAVELVSDVFLPMEKQK
jgi:hypothetical protein